MKTLYIPVFWIGFALSLCALLMSSERLKAQPAGHGQVVLKIPSEFATVPETHLGSASHPEFGLPPSMDEYPIQVREEQIWQVRADGFLSAAEAALE